jgi:hypothetical protein
VSQSDESSGETLEGERRIHALIEELAASGRAPTAAELAAIREHVAHAGFDPNARERARNSASETFWQAREVRSSDLLPPVVAHYLRHVVRKTEWPVGTTLAEYVQSAEAVVRSDLSGVFLSEYQGALQVGFVSRSGAWRGPGGKRWVLVEYRLATAHWVTAYQIRLRALRHPARARLQWLRAPR